MRRFYSSSELSRKLFPMLKWLDENVEPNVTGDWSKWEVYSDGSSYTNWRVVSHRWEISRQDGQITITVDDQHQFLWMLRWET